MAELDPSKHDTTIFIVDSDKFVRGECICGWHDKVLAKDLNVHLFELAKSHEKYATAES